MVSYLQNSDWLQLQTEKRLSGITYISARIELAIHLGMYTYVINAIFNYFLIIYTIINSLTLAHAQVHSPL